MSFQATVIQPDGVGSNSAESAELLDNSASLVLTQSVEPVHGPGWYEKALARTNSTKLVPSRPSFKTEVWLTDECERQAWHLR